MSLSSWVIIGQDSRLVPVRHQTLTWTSAPSRQLDPQEHNWWNFNRKTYIFSQKKCKTVKCGLFSQGFYMDPWKLGIGIESVDISFICLQFVFRDGEVSTDRPISEGHNRVIIRAIKQSTEATVKKLIHIPWTKLLPFHIFTFSNAFSWMKSFVFRFLRVQLTISQHGFR